MTSIKEPQRVHNIPGPIPLNAPKEKPADVPTRIEKTTALPVPNWPTREKTPATPAVLKGK
jgi:hypothetical protein